MYSRIQKSTTIRRFIIPCPLQPVFSSPIAVRVNHHATHHSANHTPDDVVESRTT